MTKPKINFTIKNLLSDLEEYDIRQIKKNNKMKSELSQKRQERFEQYELEQEKLYPQITNEEMDKIRQHFPDGVGCWCCSSFAIEQCIGRLIKPCKGCYCCL